MQQHSQWESFTINHQRAFQCKEEHAFASISLRKSINEAMMSPPPISTPLVNSGSSTLVTGGHGAIPFPVNGEF
jgi:hypothetical protein